MQVLADPRGDIRFHIQIQKKKANFIFNVYFRRKGEREVVGPPNNERFSKKISRIPV